MKKNDGNTGNTVYLICGSALLTSVVSRHENQTVPEEIILQTG